jgi:DNA-directed RNA polymerase subunit RPC12/RpoP
MIKSYKCESCKKEFAASRLPPQQNGTRLCPNCGSKVVVSKTACGDNNGRVKSKGRNKHRTPNKTRQSGR